MKAFFLPHDKGDDCYFHQNQMSTTAEISTKLACSPQTLLKKKEEKKTQYTYLRTIHYAFCKEEYAGLLDACFVCCLSNYVAAEITITNVRDKSYFQPYSFDRRPAR